MITDILDFVSVGLLGAAIAIPMAADAVDPTSLSGGAGWVGAGLLGAVLSWLLLIHLPAKDKQFTSLTEVKDAQIRSIIDSKDRQLTELLAAKWAAIQEITKETKYMVKTVAGHCERELEKITARFSHEMDRLIEAVKTERSEDQS
jgi:hypothetical protein